MKYIKTYESFSIAGNYGILANGQKFWIGTINLRTGIIEESHTYEEAQKGDFHYEFYFSDEQIKKIDNEICDIFWVEDSNGSISTNSDYVIEIVKKIRTYEYQKKFLTKYPEKAIELKNFGIHEKIKEEFADIIEGSEFGFFGLI